MRLLASAVVVALVALAAADDAEPVCAKTCSTRDDGSSGFQAGHQYVYIYRGEASTSTTSGDHQQHQSPLSVAARVVVTAGASPCDLRLQIPSLEVQGDSAWLKEAVQAHDLYFSYQGGRVEELCPHEEENAAATNFKRAVLSSLHTSMSLTNPKDRLIVHEDDVGGECRTEYHLITRDNSKLVFNKTRNDCLFQHAHMPHLPHSLAPFTPPSVTPFFRSNQECQMESQKGVWQSVECQQHVEVDGPLAPSEGPVSFTLSSSLILETSRPDGNVHVPHREQWMRREPLRMSLEEDGATGQPQEASHILTQVSSTMEALLSEEVKEERPRLFSHLLGLMSHLNHEGLREMWDTYNTAENYKNIMLDGLMACDSGPCIELVTHLASDEPSTLSSASLSSWLAAMHLQGQADPASISHIMSLMESHPEAEEAVVMAASSVVFRVCQKDPKVCHNHSKPFLKYIRQEVGEGCGWGQDKQQQHRVKFALQALGNAGVIPKDNFPQRCYKNKLLSTELRVAALQTMRRAGCSGSEAPWTILEDGSDKIEVRLAAYLALQPCTSVTARFFPRLQTLLEKEEVNQVGSFIWSHVRNLAEQPGASQGEEEVARLAAQVTLNNKFNTNAFQTSRNYRLAQFSDTLGIGGIVDGDIIFTPESYLPRTAAVNLTMQLLGKSVNLFEIGGNFKGLEDYIEKFFGKGKYFENEEIQKLLQNLRPKRNTEDDKLEEYQALYDKAKGRKEDTEGEEEPAASLYLRIFGNELMRSENILKCDPLKAIQEALQHLSSHRAVQIMNQEFVAPTLLGFPLRLKYNITGSLSLRKEGRLEAISPGQLLLEGQLSPTVTVAADETLLLDGYGSYSGIKRSTTHHAHSHLGGKVSIRRGHLVDAQLDLPETEVMKIHSSVKVTLYSNDIQGWSEPATQVHPQESEGCSSKALSDAIGLQVCHKEDLAKQPTADYVASASHYAKQLVISKSDNFDKFVFSFRKTESNVEAVFDTPGSSVNRRVSIMLNNQADGAGGTVVVPGRQMEGHYQWSPALKRITVKYYKDSEVQAEFDASLQGVREGPGMRHKSNLVLALPGLWEVRASGSLLQSPKNLSWDATLTSSFQDEPATTQGKWEVVDGQHQALAKVTMGQNFGAVSGSVLHEAALTVVEAKCEYGRDPTEANTLALSARLKEKMVNRERSLEGHASLQSSQAKASIDVEVHHRPGDTAANVSLSLSSAKINSTFVSRNIGEEGKRDFEMAFSICSQELALDYLGRALYKASDGALQVEAEARLGSLGHAKVSLSHLLQEQPFHALAGLHLQLNDHLLQASYNMDLSKSGHKEIMVSGAVGTVSAGLYAEIDHNHTQPFQMQMKVFGGRESQQIGIMLATTSDTPWQSFSGSMELTWFDWSSEVRYEAVWSDDRKEVNLFNGQDSFQLIYRAFPSPQLLLLMKSSMNPALQVLVGKTEEVRSETYQVFVKHGAEQPLRISATWNDNQSFSGTFRLLKSEVQVSGSLNQPNPHHLEGSAEVTIILPNTQRSTMHFTLFHAYDGTTREVKVSSSSGGLVYEGQFRLEQHRGWFNNDSLGLSVNVTTPITNLRSAALLLETHTDPSLVDFIQVEVEDFKVRGEAQVGDPTNLFNMKLQYEGGGSICESYAHLYHKHMDGKYLTGASVKPTQTHDPWNLEVVTLLDHTLDRKSVELEFASPLWSPPFRFYANYSRSENHVDLKLQGGMERQASLTVLAKNNHQGDTQVLGGTLELMSPWTSPVFVNVSHQHGQHGLNTTLDLRSSWQPLNNVKADISVNFVNSSDLTANFQLAHEHLQVRMDLSHRLTTGGLSSQLEFSANTVRATGKAVCTWDGNLIPQSATGHLALINMFPEPLDFNFSFIKGISDFHTQVLGSLGDSLLRIDHQLRVSHLMEWVSILSVVLPNREDIMESEATVNIMPDFISMKIKLFVRSPWTEEIKLDLSSQRKDALRDTKFSAFYGEPSLAELMLQTPEPFHWYQSDVSFNISSSHFPSFDVHWKHKFGEETLATLEIFVDNEFYLKGEQKLVLSRNRDTQNFEEFHFALTLNIPSNSFDFETKLAFQSDLSGEFQMESGDHLVHLTSFPKTGEIFTFVSQGPVHEWKATLSYSSDPTSLPNLLFNVAKDDSNIFTIESKFTELYPKLDGSFTVKVMPENEGPSKHGQLHITADMSHIQNYAFKGTAKLESNIEGFEKHAAELDVGVNVEDGSLDGKLIGALHFNDWQYKTDLFGSLELKDNQTFIYRTEYTLMHQQQVLDKKEVHLLYHANGTEFYMGNITVTPAPEAHQWSFFLSYNNQMKELKAHTIPGNARKYQAMARLDANVFKVDSQIVNEDGQPPFKVITGDISWTLRRRRRLIKVDLSSDFSLIQSVKGVIGIQRRRRLGVGAKLLINEKEVSGNVTYIPSGPRIPGRMSVELKNEVFVPFKTNIDLKYSLSPGSAETNLAIDLNDKKGWVTIDAKGSLPESYVMLKLPFKDFENVTVSLTISTSPSWGAVANVIMPKLCVNFEGTLDPKLKFASLSTKVLERCNDELFDFQFHYRIEEDSFNLMSLFRLQKYGLIYDFAAEGQVEDFLDGNLKVKAQIHNIFSLGFELSSVYDDSTWSVMIHAYNDTSKWSHFLYSHKISDSHSDLSTKVNERALLSVKAHYGGIDKDAFDVNATISHSLFYLPFSATVTLSAEKVDKEVTVNLGLSTSSPIFSQADLLIVYEEEDNKEVTLKFSSTLGNAEATVVLQESSVQNSVTFDMTSNLHSFHEYHIELTHKTEGNNHHISAVSIQDDVELELQGSLVEKTEGFEASVNLRTPFDVLETFHIGLVYPHLDSFEGHYSLDINGQVNGYMYGLTCKHEHDDSWHRQKTRIVIDTHREGFGTFSLSADYDVTSHASVVLGTSEGDISFRANWEDLKTHFTLNLNLDLSHFGLGEYDLYCETARASQRNETIRFEYSQSLVNYTCQLTRGRNMNFMKLSVDINDPNWAFNRTAYSISYDFYSKKNLIKFEGQFKEMKASVAIMPKNIVSPLSGSFKIQTNIEGYEVLNGSWNITRRSEAYLAKMKLDINEQTVMSFSGQLNTQPQGASAPWQELELDVLFESSWTQTHHLHTEYDINTWSLSSTYKRGLDTFHLKLLPRLRQKVGTLLISGNVPIRGMSTFALDLTYKLKEVYTASLTASVEETHLMSSVELEPRKSWSSIKASLTSPYFRPLRASLLWTFKEQPWLVESSMALGKMAGELKINANPYGNMKHLELQLNLPFECFYKGLLTAKYSANQGGQIQTSAGFAINNHTLHAEAKIKYNNNIKMEFLGSENIFGTKGALEVKYENVGKSHTGNATATWSGQKVFTASFTVDPEKIQLDMEKGPVSYLSAKLTLYEVDVKFSWNTDLYFNMSCLLTPLNNNYNLVLMIESSETQPLLLRASVTTKRSQEGLAYLRIGEREYNVSVRGDISKLRSSLEFHLQPSDNTHTQIDFKANYNLQDYFQGRMNSLVDLASVTLEWGGKIQLVVKGMQNRSQSKMKFEIVTPFRSLPKLNFGYDSQYSLSRSGIDVMCTIYVEWSQKITFTGFFKLINGNLDLFIGLTSSYSDLEMFDISLKSNSNHIEAAVTVNKDKWNLTCDYQLIPFSVTLSLSTPLEDYKTLLLTASGALERGRLSGEAEFTWTNTVKIQFEAELWELDVKLYTPWKPVQEAFLKTSLRTESEALMLTAMTGWSQSTVTMKAMYSPEQVKIAAEYKEETTDIGFVTFEFVPLTSRKYRAALQVRTPSISLKSLGIEINVRPKGHEYMIDFITNSSEHILQLTVSKKQGKLRVHLPMFGKFMWTMEAKNSWLKLNTEASLSLDDASAPMKASLSYLISPEEGHANVSFKSEYPDQRLESLNFNITGDYDGTSLKALAALVWKLHYKEPSSLTADLSSGVNRRHLSTLVKFESDCFEHPIEVTCVIPLFNPLVKEGTIEVVFVYGDSYKLIYKTRNEDNYIALHQLALDIPWWLCGVELNLTQGTFNASVSTPNKSDKHILIVRWPHTSLEHFNASMEFYHPLLPTEGIKISGSFKVLRKFSFLLGLEASNGQKNISASGTLQYIRKLQQLKCEGTITSNWIGGHTLEANIQWLRNFLANIKLKTQAQEHNCSLVVDVNKYSVEFNASSPWLPYGKCSVRGKINPDLSLTKVKAEGQLEGFMEGEKLIVEVRISQEAQGTTKAMMTVKQGQEELLSLSSEVILGEGLLVIEFESQGVGTWLDTRFYLRLEDNNERRYLWTSLSENYYIPRITLHIENYKNWRKKQTINFSSSKYQFRVFSEISKQSGAFRLDITFLNFDFHVNTKYNLKEEYSFKIFMETSINALQNLVFEISLPNSKPKIELLMFYFRGQNDQEWKLNIHCIPDPVMRWSIWVYLITPFSALESFELMTPQFAYRSHIFRAYVKYPGEKVGVILSTKYRGRLSTDMQFSLYLPFEKYDIISMKIVGYDMRFRDYGAIEMRIGKIGFTLSAANASYRDVTKLELLASLNEWSIKTHLMGIWKSGRAKLHVDFSPKDLVGMQSFSTQVRYHEEEEFYFDAKADSEKLLKAHFSWGEDKIFSLTTPRVYPGHMLFHLESGVEVQDCQLQATLSTAAGGSGQPYGFHVHHRQLETGHHVALLGLAPQRQVRLEGTHHLNWKLLNESLIIEVDKQQVGYKASLKRESGVLSSTYSGGLFLVLPVHSVNVNSRLDIAIRQVDFSSQLMWGEGRASRKPLNLKLKYNDYSIFGKGKHHLRAVLSHPDIKDIRLQANMTRTLNSSLYGSAELVDDNSPEMKVVATLGAEPVRQDGWQTVNVSFTQPISKLSVHVGTQLWQSSPLSEALCHFKYYSLTSETWHHLNLSGRLEGEGSKHVVTVTAVAPETGWSRTWKGTASSQPQEASVSIEENSDGPEDGWRLGAVVRKHLPELRMYLGAGREHDVHQEVRVRLGLHSPVEVGAALDHFSFGQWHQDTAAVGLRLTTPHILQVFMEFDPSLDYSDNDFVARLTTPLHKVMYIWQHEAVSAMMGIKEWIQTELPTLSGVLINRQVLEAVWNSESDSLHSFLTEAQQVFSEASRQSLFLWREHLWPRIQQGFRLISSVHEWAQVKLEHALYHASWQLQQWTYAVKLEWRQALYQLSSLHHSIKGWWAQTESALASQLQSGMYWTVRSINLARAVAQEWISARMATLQPYWQTVTWTMDRYWQELSNTFQSECWQQMQHMANELKHSFLQALSSGWSTLRAFLQPEVTLPLLRNAWHRTTSWAQQTLAIMQGGLQQLGDSLQDSLQFTFHLHLYSALSSAWEHSQPVISDFVQNGVSAVVPYITSAVDRTFTFAGQQVSMMQAHSSGGIVDNYISTCARNVYDRLLEMWQKWKEQKEADTATADLLKGIMKTILNLEDDIFMKSYVFAPEVEGQVRYNQHLPVRWPSFLHTPLWHELAWEGDVDEAQRILHEGVKLPSSRWGIPQLRGFFLPPFVGTAVIRGQHITTFDLDHYQFLGPCSYLLTRDFVGGDFTVLGVYQVEAGLVRLASIQVLTPSKKFVLSLNGSVDATQPHAEVHSAEGRTSLKVGGLLVSCDQVSQGCSITVSSKYFGRLAGLLGNYNHEPSDDRQGPDAQRASSPAQLATWWAVGDQPCYQANLAVETNDTSASLDVAECSQLFLKSDSPLSACFYSVNPRPYFSQCISTQEGMADNVCGAASSYTTQCLAHGLSLPQPEQCRKGDEKRSSTEGPVLSGSCDVPGGEPVPSRWSKTFRGETQGSADVAFIVELANCNKGKNLQLLLQLLKVHMRRAGSEDVRYALLTVQEGSIGQPSAFMGEEEMATLLQSLDLQGPKDDLGGAAAIVSAAKRLRWRPGVSRTIVQLSCRPCDAGEVVHQALQENDVSFHLITKHKVTMAGPNPKKSEAMAKKLLGFDEKFGYTVRDIKKFAGTEKLRSALQEPEGSCVMAAQASGGSVFNMNKWLPSKQVLTKKFLRVLSNRVAMSSAAPECQNCQCLGGATEMKLQCRKCSSEFSAPVEGAAEGPEPVVRRLVAKRNYTIKADIKTHFAHHFISENAALNSFGSENEPTNLGAYESEDISSEEDYDDDEEEEEEEDYGEDDESHNYNNYGEVEYYS